VKQSIEPDKKSKSADSLLKLPPKFNKGTAAITESQLQPPRQILGRGPILGRVPNGAASANFSVSPLSLITQELNLVENSRNRKPIYINQQVGKSKS